MRDADIVSCATLSATPLVRGEWLKPGTHVDLVGAYTPKMREADDDAIRRARVYVDTRAGAPKEARRHRPAAESRRAQEGRIARRPLRPLPRRGQGPHRAPSEITLFKSVGTAIEDLAAAMLVWRSLARPEGSDTRCQCAR